MMTYRRVVAVACSIVVMAVSLLWLGVDVPMSAEKLPARLTDQEFWKLASDYSEPDGTFHSENLVSNELGFQSVIPRLVQTAPRGRAYVGVGSEQNFTYIAAVAPAVVFIVDIRRGNLDLHLVYKALFELSADRADFVSRLFSRKRPAGLGPSSTVAQIFAAYQAAAPSPALYADNLRAIESHLITKHGFALSRGDREGLAYVYNAWFTGGPDIRYQLTTGGRGGFGSGRGGGTTYADLMTATDGNGQQRSYLASEASFTFLKDLQTRNMLVPVVGNFGGPKALRAVATYLKQHEMVLSTFYASNVEQYLHQDGIWGNFCASAATMPMDASSMLIRSVRGGFANQPRTTTAGGFSSQVLPMAAELTNCATRQ